MGGADGGPKFDHVVSVVFENRSFGNLLGRLYEPGEVPSFEGVTGKELANPIPDWPIAAPTASGHPCFQAGDDRLQTVGSFRPQSGQSQQSVLTPHD